MVLKEEYQAWRYFVEGKNSDKLRELGLRPVIVDSWEESRRHGIDPRQDGRCGEVLAEAEIAEAYNKHKCKFDTIFEYMQTLYRFTQNTNFLISLTDKNGYILKVMGDKEILSHFAEFNYVPGAYWRASQVGTNSIELAIKYRKPIQVRGPEHYCQDFHDWACSAAPVFDENDSLIGVLNITGYVGAAHLHTLGMVVTAVRAIESQLKLKGVTKSLQDINKIQQAIMESISDGLLLLDKYGKIQFMNKIGGEILKVDHEAVVGKHVTEIVDFRPVILDVFKKKEGYVDREFIIRSHNRTLHFVKTAVVLKDEKGEMIGVLDTFREISRVRKLVNVMTGARASFTFDDIIGQSREILACKDLARIASQSPSHVLIQGESGTGKELFAQSIHNASGRAEGPFVAINCAAIPNELMESEFFGYVEGAFTGAHKGGRPGKFELASGGTIFLDEIGEMPYNMQVKLLRVLQEHKITRIGGSNIIPVDVRIIAATNKDLKQEVEKGHFRKDLYYRLNVLNIDIPPLRAREGDIELLAKHFLKKMNLRLGKQIEGLEPGVINALKEYNWPGNVRELENILERLVNITNGDTIAELDLQEVLSANGQYPGNRELDLQIKPLKEIEKDYMVKALEYYEGNVSRAAGALGISRGTMYNKLNEEVFKKYTL